MLQYRDASEVSELSHRISAGWDLGEIERDIPYDSIFLSVSDVLTPHEEERGRALADEFEDLKVA